MSTPSGTNGLAYVYNRRTDAAIRRLVYTLETTEHLIPPTWGANGYIELPAVDMGNGFESVTNLITATNLTFFLRLSVEAL
jgi:hypothetical protein